jgi:hypothetical protein
MNSRDVNSDPAASTLIQPARANVIARTDCLASKIAAWGHKTDKFRDQVATCIHPPFFLSVC